MKKGIHIIRAMMSDFSRIYQTFEDSIKEAKREKPIHYLAPIPKEFRDYVMSGKRRKND